MFPVEVHNQSFEKKMDDDSADLFRVSKLRKMLEPVLTSEKGVDSVLKRRIFLVTVLTKVQSSLDGLLASSSSPRTSCGEGGMSRN